MTIRTKLILWYSGLLALILVGFGAMLYGVSRYALISSIDAALNDTATEVLQNSRAVLRSEFGSPSQVFIRLPELDIFRASGVVVQVWEIGLQDPLGVEPPALPGTPDAINTVTRLAGASDNLQGYSEPLDPMALAHEHMLYMRGAPLEDMYTFIRVGDGEWRVLTRPYDIWNARRVVVQTATPVDAVNQASRGLLLMVSISFIFALGGSIALGMGLTERALKPIATITTTARHIVSADDLNKRLTWTGPMDELGSLTAVLNQMLGRLEHLFSVQQRFIADISHELRTPLTVVRGEMDMIKRYGVNPESVDAIESESARMARLVDDLLLLARLDYGGLPLTRVMLSLETVVRDVHRDALALAKDRDLKIALGEIEPVIVSGDYDRLKQLLLNLVGNAIKFTPDGGRITLELHRKRKDDGIYAVIDVSDNGIGIAPDDLPRIFDRFYQADTSRTRHHHEEGVGIGLSIARWIAEAHSGRIEVESAPKVGSLFSVYLPAIAVSGDEGGDQRTHVSPNVVTRPRLGGIIRRGGHGG
jgi:signal transduction histidine kinase